MMKCGFKKIDMYHLLHKISESILVLLHLIKLHNNEKTFSILADHQFVFTFM